MNKLQQKVRKAIRERLKKAKDCDFKRAWIPRNWTCVKDTVFSKELAEDLAELFKEAQN